MPTITPSLAPGKYLGERTVAFTFSSDITQVTLTVTAGGNTTVNQYTAADVPVLTFSAQGLNRIEAVATLTGGGTYQTSFDYILQIDELILVSSLNPDTDVYETNTGTVYTNIVGMLSMSVDIPGADLGTVWGEILLNNARVGELYYAEGRFRTPWYAGSADAVPVRTGDTFRVVVHQPFTYEKSFVVQRKEFDILGNKMAFAQAMKSVSSTLNVAQPVTSRAKLLSALHARARLVAPNLSVVRPLSVARSVSLYRDITLNRVQLVSGLNGHTIYTSRFAASDAAMLAPPVPFTVIIDAELNIIYAYDGRNSVNMVTDLTGVDARTIYGAPRAVYTPNGNSGWYRIETNGTITKIS